MNPKRKRQQQQQQQQTWIAIFKKLPTTQKNKINIYKYISVPHFLYDYINRPLPKKNNLIIQTQIWNNINKKRKSQKMSWNQQQQQQQQNMESFLIVFASFFLFS